MEDIQEQYLEYAFIESAVPVGTEAKAEVEDIVKWDQLVVRSAENDGFGDWYFLVFSPMNRPYLKDPKWFNKSGLDKCRQKAGKCAAYLFTKEIEANKIHVNGLVKSLQPLDCLLNGKKCYNKYTIYCKRLATPPDVHRVFSYITKEVKTRTFELYNDYLCSQTK